MNNLDNSKMFSEELIEELEKKEEESKQRKNIRRIFDGEAKNINPLTNIPNPQMRLYGFSELFNSVYFDTEKELIEYVKTHDTSYGSICVIEYLGKVAGRSDVIRKTNKCGKSTLYTVIDEDGYGIYNNERSIYTGKFVWEFNYGEIRDMYSAFRDRGIAFEDDRYAKIDERNRQFINMFEKSKQQVLTK